VKNLTTVVQNNDRETIFVEFRQFNFLKLINSEKPHKISTLHISSSNTILTTVRGLSTARWTTYGGILEQASY
jgi:hypothetical protein